MALNNIGLVYFKLKNYEKAIEFYRTISWYTKEVNDKMT
jgi:archaellum component FlaD/FlaE